MNSHSHTISVRTNHRIEVCSITGQIENVVARSNIQEGFVLICCPHTTAAIIVNENESRLVRDLEKMVEDLIPWNKKYAHNEIDGNAASHMVGTILGNSVTLPVTNGSVDLGTWQSIFLLELDGARTRQVKVKVMGE